MIHMNEASGDFITEEDVAASLLLKEDSFGNEEEDSVSLGGASQESVGSLSNISTASGFSLNALKLRKNQLIESIKSQLNTSRIGDDCTTPNASFSFDDRPFTSTPCPYKEHVPPAAKLLKDWKCFSNIEEIADKDDSSETPVRYEEAFDSLREILGESEDMLGAYESALEVYKQNEDKKLEEIMSFFEEGKDTLSDQDITVIDLVTKVEDDEQRVDDKSKDNNDNTIIIDNSVSVEQITIIEAATKETDKEIKKEGEPDLKDPENVIIAAEEDVNADDTLVNEEDEERLLASDDEQAPVSAAAPVEDEKKVWTEFVSNDPEENRDNNDPQWENLRNLGTDFERYAVVRERWKNIPVPNPKKDLTCRCRPLPKDSRQNFVPTTQSRKRLRSPDNNFNNNKRPKVECCTMLFDREIKKGLWDLEYQKKKLDQEQERSLNQLADAQRLDQIAAYHRCITDQEIKAMKNGHYKELYSLIENFRVRRDHLITVSKHKIEDLRRAAAEVREFHEFYPTKEQVEGKVDKKSLTYLSAIEVQEIEDIESMFVQFEQFYALPNS